MYIQQYVWLKFKICKNQIKHNSKMYNFTQCVNIIFLENKYKKMARKVQYL